jgi:Flp pilus assembly pilin Flp
MERWPVYPIFRGRDRFVADESGATITEYGLLLLLVAVVVFGMAKLLGQNVLPLYNLGQYLQ